MIRETINRLRQRIPSIIQSRRGIPAMLFLAILLAQDVRLNAEVGKRSKIKGQKVSAKPETTTAPAFRIGSLQLTQSMSQAWKSCSLETLRSCMPVADSLYVIGNFSDTNERLKREIGKMGKEIRIIEESNDALVIYASRESVIKLTQFREEKWLDIIEPLTPKRKLTLELQTYIARLRPSGARPGLSPASGRDGTATPLEIIREGQPQVLDHTDDDNAQPFIDDPQLNVTFYLFKNQPDDEVRDRITEVGGTVVAFGGDDTIKVVRARIPASKVESVSAAPAVREGTLDPKFIKHNDVAQKTLVRIPPPFDLPIQGEGQIVGHSDSGLDNGKNDSSLHLSFRGRLKKAFALGRPAGPGDWSDHGGHGTHTAGSILGGAQFSGIAPKAVLVHQSLDDQNGDLSGIPTPLGTLFNQAYDEGARIHSNSWGVSAIDPVLGNVYGGVYLDGEEVDSWSWNNGSPRDMLIILSAGNDGDFDVDNGKMTVTAPGTAKNALTVGASENLRPAGGTAGDNPNDLAFFSSKGPTRENRIKPDVVAPGTWIASAKTQGEHIVWQHDVENVTIHSTSSNSWNVTAGFQHVTNPQGGALSGVGVWRLRRAAGATFQDILTTPGVAIPVGHGLSLELWVRGDINGLDRFHVGFQAGSNISVFPDRGRRQFQDWTVITTQIPAYLSGTSIRFVLVAQEAGGLGSEVTLFVDQLKLTTFSSWDSLSALGLATPNDAIDRAYTFSGGTSMATPLVAGCAALVRQSIMDAGIVSPSAELIKGILINCADPHLGSRPNFQAGWGLVNLRRAIESNYAFDFESTLQNGESITYDVSVAADIEQFRVTLVWADSPNAKLVNDLDLKIIAPSTNEHLAADPDDNRPDRTNNVEGIDILDPEAGTWKVNVTAHKVAQGVNLPFAVVVSQIP